MCGICGFTTNGDEHDAHVIGQMNDALVHRGPDEGGAIRHGSARIAMRRLSIVDIAGGQQPMVTSDGRCAVVYNGEVYDFDAHRRGLEQRGASFATRSDTEVVLQSYALDGIDSFGELNGMFAFAISDAEDRSLVLVRDPIGIKPLYYHHAPDGTLVFASELASLLEHPLVPRKLDHAALASLLVDRFVGEPHTLLSDVYQLPPGHYLRWHRGRIAVKEYYGFFPDPRPQRFEEVVEELRALLDETVASQLVADVPVAAFLSGGIDSSTVVAFAARAHERQLHTFSIGFSHGDYDETAVAREVAKHVGTRHHEHRVESGAFDPELMDRIVRHVGQPIGDPSCVPTFLVSQFAREHVKVVVSGDGGDEFFAGYPRIQWAAKIRRLKNAPTPLRRLAHKTLTATESTNGKLSVLSRRLRKALAVSLDDLENLERRIWALWQPEELVSLLRDAPSELRPVTSRRIVDPSCVSAEDRAMDYFAKTSLVNGILRKVDRMSMAASLEVRVPLLDRRIVEFALRLPLEAKIRSGSGKIALREASRPYLPDAVFTHPKQGFLPPLFEWFNDEFWNMLREQSSPGGSLLGLFHSEAIRRIIEDAKEPFSHQARLSFDAAAARAWLLAQIGRWISMFRISI